MKRTVRLSTLPLNTGKQAELRSVIAAYADAKRGFVRLLHPTVMWHHLDDKWGFRDWAKAEGSYPKGVNVHLVDQAVFDAVDTCVRHIESCIAIANIKARIWRRFTDEYERHYAYACLVRYSALCEIMAGGTPDLNAGDLSPDRQAKVTRYLHRVLRKAFRCTWPAVKLARSIALDETLYSVFFTEQARSPGICQYVSVVGAKPRHGTVLPLTGVSRISGNIRAVLDDDLNRAAIHVSYDIASIGDPTGPAKSIDWGVTEVCTDNDGLKYGKGYGVALTSMTEQRNKTGKARHKLRAISKKDAGGKRAKRIARSNLGTKKQKARLDRNRAQLRTISGSAVKEVIYGEGNRTRKMGKVAQSPEQRPRTLVAEDLAHLRGKAKSKKISRVCSSWSRAENEGRIAVHTYVGGSDMKTANAAYTSQMCPDPTCGYVHKDNRRGDKFHCRNPYWDCNWQGDADHVAAMNLMMRIGDRKISLFTHYTEVRKILNGRFLRRMESRTGGRDATPGRQSQRNAASTPGVRGPSVDGNATAHGRTPSKPRRQKPDVGGGNTDSQSPVPVVGTGETQRLGSEKKRSA
ncbi:MAG: zinc ribbon domain-containing protein [Acidimicrobiales bacterium]